MLANSQNWHCKINCVRLTGFMEIRNRCRVVALTAITAIACYALTACSPANTAEASGRAPSATKLRLAYEKCASGGNGVTLGDNDTTLMIDGKRNLTDPEKELIKKGTLSEDYHDRIIEGASLDEIVCLLQFLEVPDRVIYAMDHTSSNSGRVSESWDGIEASWTYHPSNGLDIILTTS